MKNPGIRTIGQTAPLGATFVDGGVNFSLYSSGATSVELVFFDHKNDAKPARVITLDPAIHRTHPYWHIFVPSIKAGQIYGYRIHGPFEPEKGLRFDPSKILLDPYGREVAVPDNYNRLLAAKPGDNAQSAMKSVVVDLKDYDWQGDEPLHNPSSQTIIYEMHVRGFTQHPSSAIDEKIRGTYAGLIEKIPYLQRLGVTAVELLPVFQFDPQDAPQGHINYWGYAPISFFSPHQAYSSNKQPLGPVNEFRDMVKTLHKAGIEIILDVVFNHTSEGNHNGPTQCFRGIDNLTYYILEPDRMYYSNYTGTGNTLNANHPVVRRMIIHSLHYWVKEMHVDGFRFDLASILARDTDGLPMAKPPVLWDIDSDPILAGTKLIAEAWDAAGLYQVGSFIGDIWKEWNGRFRDDVRKFFRGDPKTVNRLADRLIGSPEIYSHENREAEQSINFVTCHDGFTMNDLVSYNNKHNYANGENNCDGNNDNESWNCGVEGPTSDPLINELRNRQAKNFFAATLLSIGVPMILMGDEVLRTQNGNNNAYCQDNELSWFDWTQINKHADILRFASLLTARRQLRVFQGEHPRLSLIQLLQNAKITWHGVKLFQPDWHDDSHCLALNAELNDFLIIHWILNAFWEPLDFELPQNNGSIWRRWIDTSLESPDDIVDWNKAQPIEGLIYRAGARSTVVLFKNLS